MNKNIALVSLVGGVCAIALVTLVVWLIRSEGARTRESLREAAREAGKEVRQGLVEGAERAVDKAAEVPGKVFHDVRGELAGDAGRAVGAVGAAAGDILRQSSDVVSDTLRGSGPAAPAGDILRQSSDVVSRTLRGSGPAVPVTPPEGAKVSRAPAPTLADLFALGHKASQTVDEMGQRILGLSPAEELKVGREVHQLVCQDRRIVDSPDRTRRLEELARPLLEQRQHKELTYRFSVLDDRAVDAFAHVGGYIYVTQGLLDLVRSDPELQVVLGHEIAHVDLQHATKQITYAARAAEATGKAGFTITQLAYRMIATGYNEDLEFQADERGFRTLLATGCKRDEALAFYRRFEQYVKSHRLEAEPPRPSNVLQSAVQEVQNHFRTHPPVAERLRRLEALK